MIQIFWNVQVEAFLIIDSFIIWKIFVISLFGKFLLESLEAGFSHFEGMILIIIIINY